MKSNTQIKYQTKNVNQNLSRLTLHCAHQTTFSPEVKLSHAGVGLYNTGGRPNSLAHTVKTTKHQTVQSRDNAISHGTCCPLGVVCQDV